MRRHITSAVVITGAILVLPIIALAQSWSPAPGTPPSNNAPTPLNVSSTAQVKAGDLGTNGNFAAVGSASFNGGLINTAGDAGYGPLTVHSWGLGSAGTIYLEAPVGGALYFTDSWGGTGSANFRVGQVNFQNVAGTVTGSVDSAGAATFTNVTSPRYCIGGSCITAWPVVGGGGTLTSISQGSGIILTPNPITTTGTVAADTSFLQRRVSSCGAGQAIQIVNADGTVGCVSTGGGGTVTSVGAGTNISITGSASAPVVNVVASPTFAGNVTAAAFFYSSDKNLKTNIAELDPNISLHNIQKLQGVSFNWKADGSPSVGLVAQDVEKVYPELVKTDPATGLKSVEYGNLVAPLIEAVKAQQKEIDALKAEVDALKAGIR